jgi:hypothetical protein
MKLVLLAVAVAVLVLLAVTQQVAEVARVALLFK